MKTSSRWSRSFKVFIRHRSGVVGFAIVTVIFTVALLAPFIAPHDPFTMRVAHRFESPSWTFPFGTDEYGRCILSRILFAAILPFKIGALSVLLGGVIGVSTGLIAGYTGGILDAVVMRFYDTLIAIPPLLMAIVVAVIIGKSDMSLVIALGISQTPIFARLMRAETLRIRGQTYVEAARAAGASDIHILKSAIFPNAVAVLIVQATITFAALIILSAALNFLGYGTPPPYPAWGKMLSVGRGYMAYSPWGIVFPSLSIVTLVLGTYLLGDGLRDALDPKLY